MKITIQQTLICLFFTIHSLVAQSLQPPNENSCKTTFKTQPVFENEQAKKEYEDFEKYTEEFVKNFDYKSMGGNCYVIPVVFHVYGTTQGGLPVNASIINGAMSMLNEDFHGLNADYATVHNSFLSIRASLPDVTFALAEIDTNGNPTNGIVNHPVTSGYANGSGYDALIAADAWDNYRYMNIYIMNDLFGDSVYNNSGYSYYPSTTMSDNNTARIVYNGAYLGVNCNGWQPEFASTLTHEYGHWLNLAHTFDMGCTMPNDNVTDTPPCDYSGSPYPCHSSPSDPNPVNCFSNLINAENYMDYAGATGCYKMFTQGQAARMYAALSHPSRQPLWQLSNLVATGLDYLCGAGIVNYNSSDFAIYPNPSNGVFNIASNMNLEKATVTITNLVGQKISSEQNFISDYKSQINISGNPPGIYLIQIKYEQSVYVYKLNLQ